MAQLQCASRSGEAQIVTDPLTFGEDELVECAEQAQDFLIEHFVVIWPECPVHGDPMWPTLLSDRATWVFQQDRTVRSEIGSLRA